jgi:hypothetical protein
METLKKDKIEKQNKADKELLQHLFSEWENWVGTESNFKISSVWDEKNNNFLLLSTGWDNYKRIHSVFIHVELREGKFCIEADQTSNGFACDLVDNGIPKERIVLAFKHPELRQYSEYAEAA